MCIPYNKIYRTKRGRGFWKTWESEGEEDVPRGRKEEVDKAFGRKHSKGPIGKQIPGYGS